MLLSCNLTVLRGSYSAVLMTNDKTGREGMWARPPEIKPQVMTAVKRPSSPIHPKYAILSARSRLKTKVWPTSVECRRNL